MRPDLFQWSKTSHGAYLWLRRLSVLAVLSVSEGVGVVFFSWPMFRTGVTPAPLPNPIRPEPRVTSCVYFRHTVVRSKTWIANTLRARLIR
jgi:hypothetical protein